MLSSFIAKVEPLEISKNHSKSRDAGDIIVPCNSSRPRSGDNWE